MHNIKLMREAKGLSQRELAQCLNITQQSVYKYETGQALPNLSTLREMSEFFDTTIDYLVATEPAEDSSNAPRLRLSKDEYAIIQKYRQLPSQSKKMLRNIATKMLHDTNTDNH